MRGGPACSEYRLILNLAPVTYLCSVVSAELYAGALDSLAVRTVDRVVFRFNAVGRILPPSNNTWNLAGRVLSRIRTKEPELQSRISGLFNDVLIALASLQIGATLYTTDAQDFRLIQRYRSIDLKILD